MSHERIKTGVDDLDEDIALLLDLRGSKVLKDIQGILLNKEASLEEISENINVKIIRIVLFLNNTESYEQVKKECSLEDQEVLNTAKIFVDEELSLLLTHPSVVSLLQKVKDHSQEQEKDQSAIRFNVITGLNILRQWDQADDSVLKPALRVAFRNFKNESLLDSTMNWEEISFLTEACLSTMDDEFNRGLSFLDVSGVDMRVDHKEVIAERLISMKRHLESLFNLAPKYGIKLSDSSDDE